MEIGAVTQIQWFAFVILPACLAVIAFVTARLFERAHPVPESSPGERSETRGSGAA